MTHLARIAGSLVMAFFLASAPTGPEVLRRAISIRLPEKEGRKILHPGRNFFWMFLPFFYMFLVD